MQVMQELGLIGLRIQRMPSEPGLEFGIPSQYSYMTVKILFSCFTIFMLLFTIGFLEILIILPSSHYLQNNNHCYV